MEKFFHKKKYLMYGKHAVIAALSNPKRKIYELYCSINVYSKYRYLVNKFNYQIKDTKFLSQLIKNDNHQGLVACVESVYHASSSIQVFAQENFVVILDQVQDAQNIGAIIRSANSFNIRNFIFTENKSPEENGLLAKAAAGSLEYSKVLLVKNLNNVLIQLKKIGFWVVGLSSHSNQNLADVTVIPKIALIIGSEAKGIRKLVLSHCDFQVKIPINHKTESLNASNAAAIAFYHLTNIGNFIDK